MSKLRSSKERRLKRTIHRAIQKTNDVGEKRRAAMKTVKQSPPNWTGYFEKQYKQHCQIHAINNALGSKVLTYSPLETWRKKHQGIKWTSEGIKSISERTPAITGSANGHWTRSTVFSVLRQRGYEPCTVNCIIARKSTEFLPWLQQLQGPHIVYLCYETKSIDRRTMQACLQEVKHCVALLGGTILDSELGCRAIPLINYPHLASIGSIYHLIPTMKD
jgi:hypothetical protein